MPSHNRKPLSPAGLTISKRHRTLYPTQLGYIKNCVYGYPHYAWPGNAARPHRHEYPWGPGYELAIKQYEAAKASAEKHKPLLAKKGDYAWNWQANRDMHEQNVGTVILDVTDSGKRLLLPNGTFVYQNDALIKITKKQYLEVLQHTKARKVLRRMGIVK